MTKIIEFKKMNEGGRTEMTGEFGALIDDCVSKANDILNSDSYAKMSNWTRDNEGNECTLDSWIAGIDAATNESRQLIENLFEE